MRLFDLDELINGGYDDRRGQLRSSSPTRRASDRVCRQRARWRR
jgi:hypothetical protein